MPQRKHRFYFLWFQTAFWDFILTKCVFLFYFPHNADAELYVTMVEQIKHTTTVWVEHDFALISILLLDFMLPFLVVSEENLPTTWCRISPRFKRKKKKLISIARGGWNARSANCISYRYFQKIMSQWNEEEKSLILFSVS